MLFKIRIDYNFDLQHWQHDVAIHSQYCISLAFCEKVAANLSPQSTRLSMWRGKQPRYGMKGVGSTPSPRVVPVPLINGPSPRLPPPPPHSLSPGGACSLRLQIKAIGPPLLPVCDGRKSELFLCRPMCHFLLFAGTWWLEEERRVEWQPDGSHNKTVIERYVIVTISSWGKWYQRDIPAKKRRRKGTSFN